MKSLIVLVLSTPGLLALPLSEATTTTTAADKPQLLPRQSSVPFFPSDFFQGTEISSDVSYLPTSAAVGTGAAAGDQDPCVSGATNIGGFAATATTTRFKGQTTWVAVWPETTIEWPFLEGPPIVIGGGDEEYAEAIVVL